MHVLLPLLGLAAFSQSTGPLPDTAAAKQIQAFLTAFNSGNRATVRSFIAANFDQPPNVPGFVDDLTDTQMSSFAQSGGFVVKKAENLASAAIRVHAQAKLTGAWSLISMYVTAKPPEYKEACAPFHIVGLGFQSEQAPAEFVEHRQLSEGELRSRIGSLLHTLAARDQFSGTVTVAKGDQILFSRAYGLASRAWNVPNRTDTKFNLASITKMFTAVAVAELVEQGKLSFDEKVGELLPEYPNKEVASKVTIGELLSHTSGLIGARDQVENHPEPESAKTIAERVKSFQDLPLSFEPGQRFDYSNAGYALLGAIIEKASGQSYYQYVREHVFKSAGMSHTDFYELDTDPANLAEGLEDAAGGKRLNNMFDLGSGLGSPAGGASSNGEDMVRFSTALSTGKLVRKETLDRLWTGVSTREGRHDEYGYGTEISSSYGWRAIGHGGGWKGVTNHFEILPELGYTIVVLTNIDDDPNLIDFKIREWLTQGRPAP